MLEGRDAGWDGRSALVVVMGQPKGRLLTLVGVR